MKVHVYLKCMFTYITGISYCSDEGVCLPKVYTHLYYIPNNIIYKIVKRLNIVTEKLYACLTKVYIHLYYMYLILFR